MVWVRGQGGTERGVVEAGVVRTGGQAAVVVGGGQRGLSPAATSQTGVWCTVRGVLCCVWHSGSGPRPRRTTTPRRNRGTAARPVAYPMPQHTSALPRYLTHQGIWRNWVWTHTPLQACLDVPTRQRAAGLARQSDVPPHPCPSTTPPATHTYIAPSTQPLHTRRRPLCPSPSLTDAPSPPPTRSDYVAIGEYNAAGCVHDEPRGIGRRSGLRVERPRLRHPAADPAHRTHTIRSDI